MDIVRLSAAALRRWYLLLPLLLLTALGVVVVGDRVNPEYQANGTILFYSPAAGESGDGNPYGDSAQAATAIDVIVSGTTVRRTLVEDGLSSDYEIDSVQTRAGAASPILSVLVRADDPEQATATRDALVEVMGEQLEARQAELSVPAVARTQITVLDAPAGTFPLTTGPLRAQVVVLVLGVALSFLLAVLLDELVAASRRRAARRRTEVLQRLSNGAADGRTQNTDHPVPTARDFGSRVAETHGDQFTGARGRAGEGAPR